MTKYGWFAFTLYVWYWNTWNYTDKIDKIIECGLKNNVDGSRYANPTYQRRTWAEVHYNFQEMYDVVSIWWHPAIWAMFSTFLAFLLGLYDWAFLITSVVFMNDY